MVFKRFATMLAFVGLVTSHSAEARADEGAKTFVQAQHAKLTELLRTTGQGREGRLDAAMEQMVDFEEISRRAFGQPCPTANSNCTNHWNELTEPQRAEVSALLRRLVEKNYRKNLAKTLDYEVTYRGTKDTPGASKVRTEAKSKLNPRDPAVQVDYVVQSIKNEYRVVDIVTEGSSLTKNYYDQFHKMLTNPSQGYAHVVTKLKEKLAKKD